MKSSARTDDSVQLVAEYAHGTMLITYAAKRCCLEITVQNVNGALSECLHWLLTAGVERASRNGLVLYSPEPVLVTYTRPLQRVLFSPLRDANPFFFMMESIWILAGRNDIAWPVYFNKNFARYSDNGVTQRGAYGARWRRWFGYDQLLLIAEELRCNPEGRRCVLTMWDADATGVGKSSDLRVGISGGADVPCNTHAYFDCDATGALNMTVCNRSNDLLWGLAGANAVHFSMLLEYMAARVGCAVGVYRQFTNNLHAYVDTAGDRARMRQLATDAAAHDYYYNTRRKVNSLPLVAVDPEIWDADLKLFLDNPLRPVTHYAERFFAYVAAPMYAAWYARKEQRLTGLEQAARILAEDWRWACVDWIERREAKKAAQNA